MNLGPTNTNCCSNFMMQLYVNSAVYICGRRMVYFFYVE